MRLRFRMPLPPSINHAYQHFSRMKLTTLAELFRNLVRWKAREVMMQQPDDLLRGKLSVTLHFFTEAGDADNRVKQAFDALNTTLWVDDRQVKHFEVFLWDEPHPDGSFAVVEVEPYDELLRPPDVSDLPE